jgi:predicted DNA-binding transcriptional regulator AlpA
VAEEKDSGIRPLLTVSQLSHTLGLSMSWIYRRTGSKAVDPIPVVRFGKRGVRFNPDHILLYIRSRERHSAELFAIPAVSSTSTTPRVWSGLTLPLNGSNLSAIDSQECSLKGIILTAAAGNNLRRSAAEMVADIRSRQGGDRLRS